MPELAFGEDIFSAPYSPQIPSTLISGSLLLEDGFKLLQEDGSEILL